MTILFISLLLFSVTSVLFASSVLFLGFSFGFYV